MPLQKVLEIVTDDPFSTLPVPFCTKTIKFPHHPFSSYYPLWHHPYSQSMVIIHGGFKINI